VKPTSAWTVANIVVSYRSDYDATIFVRESIALVVLVVILFLQTWRASDAAVSDVW
jgi:hypothetical protein